MKHKKKKRESTTSDFFHLLSKNRSFTKDLVTFRSKYGIKKGGYSFEKDFDSAFIELSSFFIQNPELIKSYNNDIQELFNRYKVPANLLSRFKVILMFKHDGKRFIEDISRSVDKKYALDYSTNDKNIIENTWKETGRPYIKLLISENWSANGIDLFLRRHKKIIRSFFDKNGQLEVKRDRKLNNLKRNEIIWKLWKLPLKKLLLMCNGGIFEYKAGAIVYILQKNHGYMMTSSAVKKVAEQMAEVQEN